MLEDLTIKDFALIDNATLEFSSGFTILSGETGAGKSLLIGALSFLLGAKGSVELIRADAEEASVCATFYIEEKNQNPKNENLFSQNEAQESPEIDRECKNAEEWLFKRGISTENGRIILRRFIRKNGKSGAWIGSTQVSRTDLAEFGTFLLDIHGQHEHQSLLKVGEHRKFLDSFAEITDEVENFTELYSNLVLKRKKLSKIEENRAESEEKAEKLKFAINEIEEASLKMGEDKELSEEENRLLSFEKIFLQCDAINSAFDGENGLISLAKKLRQKSDSLSALDSSTENLSKRIENLFFELSDIAEEYRAYSHKLIFDPARLSQVQERLALLFQLKRKYAPLSSNSIDYVISYAENAKKTLSEMKLSAEDLSNLKNEISLLEKKVYHTAKILSQKRLEAAKKMSEQVERVLSELGMNQTRFSVSVTQKNGTDWTQSCGQFGIDNVEFLISANPGVPLGALEKIASGGELSRVMLALKTVLFKSDFVGTMIFDEIDTGIGGEVAVSVGKHLKNLSKKSQILCITHLASIAVFADNQIKSEKSFENEKTRTKVYSLSQEARVLEIARMLSGDVQSPQSLEHARTLLQKYQGRTKNG